MVHYKIQAGIDEIHWYAIPTTREPIGGHRPQLQKETAQRSNFYKNGVVNNWIKLADYSYCTINKRLKKPARHRPKRLLKLNRVLCDMKVIMP